MGNFRVFFEDVDKVLILMRGVSGTGKSTRARQLAGPGGAVYSTDDFFGAENEEYAANYSMEKLPEAHAWNQQRVEDALQRGVSPVIVDNTNIMPYEAKPYVQMAQKHGYRVSIEEPQTDHWRRVQTERSPGEIERLAQELAKRNLHGAPPEIVSQMISQYSPYSIEDALGSIAPWEKNA